MPANGEPDSGTAAGGLASLSGISLDDLERLDDSVVAAALRDLVRRDRCGNESGERTNNFGSAI
jgi:hypothetical protein